MITVPAELRAERPTQVTLRGRAGSRGHLVVDVQPFAEAVVVLDHAGSATYADNVEVLIGEGAHRRWCSSRTGTTTRSICRITAT